MNKYLNIVAAGLITSATLLFAAAPATAAGVDIHVGVPVVVAQPQTVYVQPRPIYIQPQYESDWRARQLRAAEWRNNPNNHGQVVSAEAHARNDARKNGHGKHHSKHNGKHHGKHNGKGKNKHH